MENADLELPQEANVVLVKLANVADAVPAGADPFDPQAEGEAGDFLGIVADGPQHVGIDHAGPTHFDPAHAAARIVPAHVDFDARLGERKERGAEADMDVGRPGSWRRTAAARFSDRPSSRGDRSSRPSIWWNIG